MLSFQPTAWLLGNLVRGSSRRESSRQIARSTIRRSSCITCSGLGVLARSPGLISVTGLLAFLEHRPFGMTGLVGKLHYFRKDRCFEGRSLLKKVASPRSVGWFWQPGSGQPLLDLLEPDLAGSAELFQRRHGGT